ncbi:MAG: hypothetical protein JF609_07965, partial [Verrucomicrobia bacterium]|nr:hypothetical protein [Verrucomicrobiota bacterium]
MQLQIKSIEYKLTPENVGQLFLEHEKLSGIGFDKKRWMAPTIAGLAVAGLLFWLNYPLKGTLMINQFNLSSILNIFSLVFVLAMGFCSGFGGVLLLRKLLLETVLQKA